VGERFQGVLIENRPAIDVLRAHDAPDTLHYADPPYVHATRCRINGKAGRGYRHEMSDADHAELLQVLDGLAGMVVLSGYDTALYRDALGGGLDDEHHQRPDIGRARRCDAAGGDLDESCVPGCASQHARRAVRGWLICPRPPPSPCCRPSGRQTRRRRLGWWPP
jgi:site-specific DNA-adenine methylase